MLDGEESRQLENEILITKLSFKGTFPIKSTLVDIIF